VISLRGGAVGAARLISSNGELPTLAADPTAGQSMTEAARQALRRIDAVLADNSEALKSSITNLNTFTGALARNSDRVDGILSGLERMTNGAPAKATPTLYDLTAPHIFPASDKAAKSQLVVLEPTALIAFDTRNIIIAPGAGETLSADAVQWTDNIPKLVQARSRGRWRDSAPIINC
jgi:phospholipid/cholesterol/gamma-HCH transport system substrate-binding protein